MIVYFTKESYERMVQELNNLEEKTKKLYNLVNETCGGDWHDNANYDNLMRDIGLSDSRIRERRNQLAQAKIISYPTSVDSVVLGTKVNITKDGSPDTICIVAEGDTDITAKKIRYDAPLASRLLGSKVGDSYTAKIGNKDVRIEILDVQPIDKP
ncbi:MAG: GreA/GreB family elongation factor [Candidatus Woesearchaeota archaeon]